MSKSPRKKKPTTNNRKVQAQISRVHAATRLVFNELRITYSSVSKAPKLDHYEILSRFLKKDSSNDFNIGINVLDRQLKEDEINWQYLAMIFYKGEDGYTDYAIANGMINKTYLHELTNIMPILVDDVIDTEELDTSKVLGWSWVLSPSRYQDFGNSHEFFAEYFIEKMDVLNQDKRKEILSYHNLGE